MEQIILEIMKLISASLPELSLIDEDYGQLELQSAEDTYPVTFPCVLIGNAEGNWDTLSDCAQRGKISLTVRLAIDCYDDTHIGSGTEDKIIERMQLNNRLYVSLQGKAVVDGMTELHRIHSRDFSLFRGIKCYETIFSFATMDESAAQ